MMLLLTACSGKEEVSQQPGNSEADIVMNEDNDGKT